MNRECSSTSKLRTIVSNKLIYCFTIFAEANSKVKSVWNLKMKPKTYRPKTVTMREKNVIKWLFSKCREVNEFKWVQKQTHTQQKILVTIKRLWFWPEIALAGGKHAKRESCPPGFNHVLHLKIEWLLLIDQNNIMKHSECIAFLW